MINDICQIKFESIASGGEAFGRINWKPVFVTGGLPDEIAVCKITEEHKSFLKAEIIEIIEPSPVRIPSECKYYGKCGGCNFGHIDYDAQIAIKTKILKDSFLRIGNIETPKVQIFPSLPWEYRNRMQFHCFRERKKNSEDSNFGLKGRKSEEIISVSDCHIAVTGIREILKGKGKKITLPPEKDRFTVFSKDGLLLNEGGIQRGKIKLLNKEFLLDVQVFFQSNIVMLEKLIIELEKTADAADHSLPMADLYCGVGTFAVFLAENFPAVIMAEENKTAISLARENMKGINTELFALRDKDWHNAFLRRKEKIGFIVIDPPRQGIHAKFASVLAQDGPPLLVYVSCDPSSLARDAKIFAGGGYKLTKLSLFDFYPQTFHIETMAVFESIR